MEKFNMYNPVKLSFGKNVVDNLGESAAGYGKKALLIFGKGSVKRNGAYDDSVKSLKNAGIEIVEYNGIKSNPVIEDADKAAEIGRKEGIDMIVAVGGGSVIDCAKVVSVAIPYSGAAWDLVEGKAEPKSSMPLLAVLTLPATGTEMNPAAVIQDDKLLKKVGFGSELMFPKQSFLDPTYTLSIPANYTAYGIVDLVAHALEAYFGKGETTLTDRFIFSIIKEALDYGPKLINNLDDYDLREKIMFAATCALNGMTTWGKEGQDWGVHQVGHVLSVMYDVPHGASLSIAHPSWMRLFKGRIPERISQLGKALFNEEDPDTVIQRFEGFFETLGAPIKLSQIGIDFSDEKVKDKVFEVIKDNNVSGCNHALSRDDYKFLIEDMA